MIYIAEQAIHISELIENVLETPVELPRSSVRDTMEAVFGVDGFIVGGVVCIG